MLNPANADAIGARMKRLLLTFAASIVAAPVPALQLDPVMLATLSTSHEDIRRDPIQFVNAVSSRIIHGEKHDLLPRALLLPLVKQGDVFLTCGPAVRLVRRELLIAGVRARNIPLKAPPPANGYDDGHILLEFDGEDGPILVDVAFKRLFLIDGKPASLAQIRDRGFDAVEIDSLPGPVRVDPSFEQAALVQSVDADPRSWYQRMFDHTFATT